MNQTTTTTTSTTHPVDLESLRFLLEEDGKVYCDAGYQNREEPRERLLHTLQTNDCRDIVTAAVDGDALANTFVVAGSTNHVDILEGFFDHGMNVDIKDKWDWTALMGASRSKCKECVRFLLDHNAKVDVQDKNGVTALMLPCQRGFTETLEMLLKKNANPNIQSGNGMTALMWASGRGSKEMVQLLLNHNADIELKNNGGETAVDFAEKEEIKEMIRNHVNTSYVLK